MKQYRPRSQPDTQLTIEIVDEICERLIDGQSLSSMLREEPHMPTRQTFLRWVRDNEWVKSRYNLARQMQYELMADDIQDIADNGINDYVERQTRNGKVVVLDDEHVRRSGMRIETRKWIMERMAAHKYGPKSAQTLTHQNPDGTPLMPTRITIRAATPEDVRLALGGPMIEGEVVDPVDTDDDL